MATLEELKARIGILNDMEEIKKLQKIYGYYVDYQMWQDVVDLFSDNTESIEVCDHGLYLGKAGVERFFLDFLGRRGQHAERPAGALALALQLQGVVDVDPGGKTARGRWHGWLIDARFGPGLPRQTWGHGFYENEYVKENGKWMFKKVHYNLTFRTPFEDGWLKNPVAGASGPNWDPRVKPDAPPTNYHPYPSGYRFPPHWKHPVTGE
jgi:hypothetical protein